MGQPFPNFYQNSGHRNGGTLYSLALIIHNRCQPSGISQTWPENRTFSRPGSHSLLGPHRALTACFAASVIVTSANPLPQRDSKASFESPQVQTKPRVFQNWHHRAHFFFSSSPCLVYFSTFLSLQESAFPLWELFTSDHFQSRLCQPPAFFFSLCLSASPSSLLGLPKHILRAQHDRAALQHSFTSHPLLPLLLASRRLSGHYDAVAVPQRATTLVWQSFLLPSTRGWGICGWGFGVGTALGFLWRDC